VVEVAVAEERARVWGVVLREQEQRRCEPRASGGGTWEEEEEHEICCLAGWILWIRDLVFSRAYL
jgi:hypothetical protein